MTSIEEQAPTYAVAQKESINNDVEASQGSVVPDSKHDVQLNKCTIYPISFLIEKGYSFGRIKINRDVDEKQVKKKKASIQTCKGIITPFLVVPANACSAIGLELEDFQGRPIKDYKLVLIILDGQHRFTALMELNTKLVKEGYPKYEGYVHLPLIDSDIPTLLRESNSATCPWDGMDWLTQSLVEAKKIGLSTMKLEWVKNKSNTGSDTAAWAWINDGRAKTKQECIKASVDEDKLRELAEESSFEVDKRLYEAAESSFFGKAKKEMGRKCLPQWVHKKLDSLIKKGDINRTQAAERLIQFLKGIGNEKALEIALLKKTSVQTKDQLMVAKLDGLYHEFEKKE